MASVFVLEMVNIKTIPRMALMDEISKPKRPPPITATAAIT